MFLIDDDQAQIGKGQEQRRACAHDQPDLPAPGHVPQAAAFGASDAAVPFAGARAEACLDPVQEFGGQRDFGQQDQRLPSLRQAFGDGLQVHLGLARPGDPAQQRGAVTARPDRAAQRVGRRLLIRCQRLAGPRGVQRRIGQIARRLDLGQGAAGDQPLDHRRADARQLRQLGGGKAGAAVIGHDLQHAGPRLGRAAGLAGARHDDAPRGGGLIDVGRARGHAQHQRQRRQRVFRRARQEIQEPRVKGLRVQHAGHGPQLGQVEITLARPPDQPQHPAWPQGHQHQLSLTHAVVGGQIVQHADRLGGQHRDAGAGGKEFGRGHDGAIKTGRGAGCKPPNGLFPFPPGPICSMTTTNAP